MKKLLLAFALAWLLMGPTYAANVNIDGLPAASSFVGTDLLECEQTGNVNRKCTGAQAAAYIYGLMGGDATAGATGAVTFSTVNSNVGSFGSTTNCVSLTVNAKGLITAASAAACAPAIGNVAGLATGVATFLATPSSANLLAALTTKTGTGPAVFGTAPTVDSLNATTAMTLAWLTGSTQCLQVNSSGTVSGTGSACGSGGGTGANPTATAGPTANNGVATTFMRSDASPAVQQGSSSQKGIVQVDGTTLLASSGVISAAPNAVAVNLQTGANYAFQSSDQTKLVQLSNASNQVPTIAQAGTTGFATGWFTQVCNIGAGTQTITPTTSTIGGASTFVLPGGTAAAPSCIAIISDGTNYAVVLDFTADASRLTAGTLGAARGGAGTISGALKGNGSGVVSQAACADLSNGAASCSTDTTNAANISTGVLGAARGGAGTVSGALKGNGSGTVSLAACADLSNGASGCSTATGTSGATLPLLNGTNTWSGTQTFGTVVGTVTTQSGTTYTFASTDCGTTVRFTSSSAVTATIPQGLPVGCAIAAVQAGSGQVSVNGSAVTPATLQSAHSYTKTFGAGAVIGLFNDATNHVVLTGDGA